MYAVLFLQLQQRVEEKMMLLRESELMVDSLRGEMSLKTAQVEQLQVALEEKSKVGRPFWKLRFQ